MAAVEIAQNSIATAPARVVGRPFAPGVSGNPGGRPKGLARYVRELVGDDGRRIADFMLSVLEDEGERTETRMEAARWLADRCFGKATQPTRREVDVAGDATLDHLRAMSDEELAAIVGEADEQP
jgi:hypothetical protein